MKTSYTLYRLSKTFSESFRTRKSIFWKFNFSSKKHQNGATQFSITGILKILKCNQFSIWDLIRWGNLIAYLLKIRFQLNHYFKFVKSWQKTTQTHKSNNQHGLEATAHFPTFPWLESGGKPSTWSPPAHWWSCLRFRIFFRKTFFSNFFYFLSKIMFSWNNDWSIFQYVNCTF